MYNAFSTSVQIREEDRLEKTIITAVKLQPEQRQKVERWGGESGLSISDVVRLLIDSVELDRSPRFVTKRTDEPTIVTMQS